MTASYGNPFLGPAIALHDIDQIIGNETMISEEELGKIRGIVLTTMNEWHRVYPNAPCHKHARIDPETEVKL